MLDPIDFESMVERKRRNRMARIDAMSPELRALVHEYGLNIVDVFLSYGVKKPARIRHAVETILDEFSPTRGSSSIQGIRTKHDI